MKIQKQPPEMFYKKEQFLKWSFFLITCSLSGLQVYWKEIGTGVFLWILLNI